MVRQFAPAWSGDGASRRSRALRGRRAAVALEFAIIALPFFTWMLFIFELSFDLFSQVALDNALHQAVRQIQTGNAQYLTNGQSFITNYLCPAANGVMNCNNLHVSVTAPTFTGTKDLYNFTTGAVPVSGHTLDLSAYSGATSFCNGSPGQFLLVSAIYVGPTFVGGLLPGLFTVLYNGSLVHPTLSTTAIVIEPYQQSPYSGTGTPAASC